MIKIAIRSISMTYRTASHFLSLLLFVCLFLSSFLSFFLSLIFPSINSFHSFMVSIIEEGILKYGIGTRRQVCVLLDRSTYLRSGIKKKEDMSAIPNLVKLFQHLYVTIIVRFVYYENVVDFHYNSFCSPLVQSYLLFIFIYN